MKSNMRKMEWGGLVKLSAETSILVLSVFSLPFLSKTRLALLLCSQIDSDSDFYSWAILTAVCILCSAELACFYEPYLEFKFCNISWSLFCVTIYFGKRKSYVISVPCSSDRLSAQRQKWGGVEASVLLLLGCTMPLSGFISFFPCILTDW